MSERGQACSRDSKQHNSCKMFQSRRPSLVAIIPVGIILLVLLQLKKVFRTETLQNVSVQETFFSCNNTSWNNIIGIIATEEGLQDRNVLQLLCCLLSWLQARPHFNIHHGGDNKPLSSSSVDGNSGPSMEELLQDGRASCQSNKRIEKI